MNGSCHAADEADVLNRYIYIYIYQNTFYGVKTYSNIWTMVWERILTYERVMSRSRRGRRIELIYMLIYIRTPSIVRKCIVTYEQVMSCSRRGRRIELIYVLIYIRTPSIVWKRILTYERIMSRSRRGRRTCGNWKLLQKKVCCSVLQCVAVCCSVLQ